LIKTIIFISILNFDVNNISIKLNIYLNIYIIVSFSLNINNTTKNYIYYKYFDFGFLKDIFFILINNFYLLFNNYTFS